MSGEDSWGFDSEIPDGQASSAELPAPVFSLGDRLDDAFELIEELGQGGFGVVYRAREVSSSREVALKILTTRLTERQRRRFEREGQLTAALRHPGIVRIHSAGESGGVPYLAYELLPGHSLKEVVADLSREARVRIVIDAARAVGYAHQQGVIHRDLKPDNLLLDDEGKVRVADFGLAWSQGVDRLTQSGAMVGTPSHMAPEQWDTTRGEVTPATDVWALGAILYHCLTDEPPFRAETLVAMGAAVVGGRLRRPRTIDPSISPALEAVCLQALAPRAEDRYPDAAALAEDLEQALAGRSTHATSASWSLNAPTARSWSWGLLLLASLVLAGLVIASSMRSKPGAVELRGWIAAAEAGDLGPLRAGLAQGVAAPPELEARARLLLAAQLPPAEALAEVDRAIALAPSGGAFETRGEALAALGRWEEATVAWRSAVERGAQPATLLALARAGLRLGRAAEAVKDCRAYLVQVEGPQLEARTLLFRAALACQDLATARTALVDLGSGVPRRRRHLFEVELLRAEGGEVEGALRKGIASWPDDPAQRRALVGVLVEQRELRAAQAAVTGWVRAGGGAEADAMRRALAGLFTLPVRLEAIPAEWTDAVGAWLIREGERELAFVAWTDDPLNETLAGAPPTATRRARARGLLRAVLSERFSAAQQAQARRGLARLYLPGDPTRAELLRSAAASLPADPLVLRLRAADALAKQRYEAVLGLVQGSNDREALELRGRACLALGRLDEAIEALTAASEYLTRIDACRALAQAYRRADRPADVAALEERIRRLAGSKRKEAQAAYEVARDLRRNSTVSRATLQDAHRRALELNPLFVDPRFELEKLRFVGGLQASGLAGVSRQIARAPRYFDDFLRNLLALSKGLMGRNGVQAVLKTAFDPGIPDEQRGWLLIAMASVEFEGRRDLIPKALRVADKLLAREPAEVATRVMRGFLNMRAGRLARAGRDLSVAHEAAPRLAPIAFYRALLAGSLQRPVGEVRALVREARELDFKAWDDVNWDVDAYPEMKRYQAQAGMDRFSK